MASFVSATSLKQECPRSLLTGLHPYHPDRETWLESFHKEKLGIQSQDTYNKITLAEYRTLRAKGAPCTIPTMCILSTKKDKMLNPLRAKSRIVILGNHEDRVWTKPEKYAPILCSDTLRVLVSMAVERRRTLKQDDCQGILTADKIRIVKPPIGDPDAKKDEYWLLKCTLYGLCRSPCHWYTKIKASSTVLALKTMHLTPACLPATSSTHPTLQLSHPRPRLPSASMSMILYTSRGTPRLNVDSNDSSQISSR